MSTVSTHVLDTSTGVPAAGVRVVLHGPHDVAPVEAVTDADGRIRPLGPEVPAGSCRIVFHTADYFERRGTVSFYPVVSVDFEVADEGHYHIPLLLAPFGFSTYRGS